MSFLSQGSMELSREYATRAVGRSRKVLINAAIKWGHLLRHQQSLADGIPKNLVSACMFGHQRRHIKITRRLIDTAQRTDNFGSVMLAAEQYKTESHE
jgi:hypothetical protein